MQRMTTWSPYPAPQAAVVDDGLAAAIREKQGARASLYRLHCVFIFPPTTSVQLKIMNGATGGQMAASGLAIATGV